MSRRVLRMIPAVALAALCVASTHGEAAGSAKFHVVLGGGPFAGTYDVTADACMAGLQKQGSWHATWEAEKVEKGKLSAVLLGIDPKPTFGTGLTMVVSFGDPDSQLMYEVLKPLTTVADRGSTATLTFKGEARTTSYEDGTQGKGGAVEITVECGKIIRGNQ
jgi:hypothetical protein